MGWWHPILLIVLFCNTGIDVLQIQINLFASCRPVYDERDQIAISNSWLKASLLAMFSMTIMLLRRQWFIHHQLVT